MTAQMITRDNKFSSTSAHAVHVSDRESPMNQCEVAREPQVQEWVCRAGSLAEDLLNRIEGLESRLDQAGILKCVAQCEASKPVPCPVLVPMAERLMNICGRLESIGIRITAVNDRLEV